MLNSYFPFLANTCSRIITILGLLVLLPSNASAGAASGTGDLVEQGRRIYQEGILGSGKDLEGSRAGNVKLKGVQAACVNCHKRSGMGSGRWRAIF